MSKISFVVPAFNEGENLRVFEKELSSLFQNGLSRHDYEIVFVNDGSSDNTEEILENLASKNPRNKFIEFSRNFGKEIATTAGIHHASGDAVMMLDADLQHPISIIPEFIKKWENGFEVVIGIRKHRASEGLFKTFTSVVFNNLIRLVSDTKIIPNATDFRLISRNVANEFKRFTERNRITRGLIDWLGFKTDYVYFSSDPRLYGKARYGFFKLMKLALHTVVSHSMFPLRIAGLLGILIIVVSGPLGLFILVEKYWLNDPLGLNFSGPAILGVITLFLSGIILTALGLIALYIENIHMEVNDRPIYVIRKKKT
ncbi:MAG TPA: glycosyltransferase family 2 protein [Verrucomicrobiae bacterium]|nr:glycosyltransferase family 2 protein [Verrucomicrobiae bacterium]